VLEVHPYAGSIDATDSYSKFFFLILTCLIMKITAKAIDENNIFIDVSVTAAAIISTFAMWQQQLPKSIQKISNRELSQVKAERDICLISLNIKIS